MSKFEYKVVVAPVRGTKSKGVRGAAARFALSLEKQMNELAADGWEYHRRETLPAQRRGLLGRRHVEEQNLLVYRRACEEAPVAAAQPVLTEVPSEPALRVEPQATEYEAADRVRRLFRSEQETLNSVPAE